MIRIIAAATAAILLVLPSVKAADDLATYLPEDTTMALVVPSTEEIDKLEEHAIVKALATPEMKAFFAPLIKRFTESSEEKDKIWKEETGMSSEEAMARLKGQFVIGFKMEFLEMMKRKFEASEKISGMPESFAFIVQFPDDEETAGKYMRATFRSNESKPKKGAEDDDGEPLKQTKFPDDFEEGSEDLDGVQIHTWKLKTGDAKVPARQYQWALVNGILVWGSSLNEPKAPLVAESISLVKKGGASLAEAARFRNARDGAGQCVAMGYMDLQTMGASMIAAMEEAVKRKGPAPGPFDPVALAKALGADQLEAAYLAVAAKGDGLDATVGITFRDTPGIMGLFQLDGAGTVPGFIPKDVASASYGTYHFDRLLPAVEKVLKEASPELAVMMTTQLDVFKSRSHVDVEKDLVGQIGPDFWMASKVSVDESAVKKLSSGDLDEDEESSPLNEMAAYGFQLKDRKAFELSLDTLINSLASGAAIFDTREVQGYTLRTLKGAAMPVGFLTTEDWLILSVGKPDLIERILKRIKDGSSDGLFAEPHVMAAINALPGDEDGSGYLDFGAVAETMIPALRRLEGLGVLDNAINFEAMPEHLDLPLSMGTRQYFDAHALVMRLHIELRRK